MDLFDAIKPASPITLRTYQDTAVDALFHYWQVGNQNGDAGELGAVGNALLVLGTGLGLSLLIAEIVRTLVTDYPGFRILMAVHVRELIEQNYKQLIALWPQGRSITGIYSAGLGRREHETQVVFGGIQSVSHKEEVDGFDLVIIDEAHRIPKDGIGRYRTLLARLRASRPHLKVVGLTATPYRLDSGRLDQGKDKLFDKIVYSYDLGPGIEDGWLAPVRSKSGVSAAQINTSGVKKTAGEFNAAQLETAALKTGIVEAACADIVRKAAGGMPIKKGSQEIEPPRKSWLIFASGVDHAAAITGELQRLGVQAHLITGETHKDVRDNIITRFRDGKITALVNVNVLTEGFDAPGVDLICLLRPTMSTGLYVQMVGRGVRHSPATLKDDCLVLDYSGNIKRHGPVDDVRPNEKNQVNARECPECGELLKKSAKVCTRCGYVFPLPEPRADDGFDRTLKHNAKPEEEISILSGRKLVPGIDTPLEVPVTAWSFSRWHSKTPGGPDTLRVSYVAGFRAYFEWICIEHPRDSYPRKKAEDWWDHHASAGGYLRGKYIEQPAPSTVDEVAQRWHDLTMPKTIKVRKEGEYWRVLGRSFAWV
jgi:DNA repair protein RadD